MRRKQLKAFILALMTILLVVAIPVLAQKKLLSVTYPPNNYQTKVDKVFFIGTAPLPDPVTINGQPVARNSAGNFAPTLPLKAGENNFSIRYRHEEVKLKVIKAANLAAMPTTAVPQENFESNRQVVLGDFSCEGITAGSNSLSSPSPVPAMVNDAVKPQAIYGAGRYLGCAVAKATGTINKFSSSSSRLQSKLSTPVHPIAASRIGATNDPNNNENSPLASREVAEVLADDTIARIGPSSDYGRVTPLPKGTKATVVGRQDGDNNGKRATWVQMDYGAWVNADDLKIAAGVKTLPQSTIRDIRSQERNGNTDVFFPLQVPVPLVIEQAEKTLKLTLYNTTAQNNSIKIRNNSIIDRVEGKAVAPSQLEYTFTFKARQQWGYKYHYDGTTLVLSLRHPPQLAKGSSQPLAGAKILLDPGHGGADSGAIGFNGYTEKEANLFAGKLLANELVARGAKVYLTRETDKTLELNERRGIVEKLEPTISLSIHYNSLPEGGDPNKAKGFSVFWYHSQARGLSDFLHNYVTQVGDRPQHGVIWDNLALVRPAAAPAVLLELGFMSNPDEFQWISDPQAQQQMAKTIANGVTQWLMNAQ